jgi:hypothetical protein
MIIPLMGDDEAYYEFLAVQALDVNLVFPSLFPNQDVYSPG